ncbi:MAG: LysE family transporter [Anaerolineae bacterium]|nr:LysE family transporter [Anaerolineae bacterium]
MSTLIRGIVIGLSIAAPVGPIGVVCIRHSLADGRAAGLVSGLGAATADTVYGAIAASGLAMISDVLVTQQFWLRLIGDLFLCYLGVSTFLAQPEQDAGAADGGGLAKAYVSTFGLTLTNPMTILSFAAIYAGLGLGGGERDLADAGTMVLGVFLGSVLWWSALSGGVSLFRAKFTPASLVWVNRISGAVILVFGVVSLLSVL